MKKNLYPILHYLFLFVGVLVISTPAPTWARSFQDWSIPEQQVLDLMNLQRSHHGLDWLKANSELHEAARLHSLDMGTNNYFSHTSQDGTTFNQRVTAQGYQWNYVGENIAAGYTTPYAVMYGTDSLAELSAFDVIQGYDGVTSWAEVGDNWSDADWEEWDAYRENQNKSSGWMGSTGHRQNILEPDFVDIGIGYAYVESADYRRYWTQDFAAGDTNPEEIPSLPTPPSASDGTFSDHVQITWDSAANVDAYKLFRCPDQGLDNCAELYAGNTAEITDETADDMIMYYYQIRNCNESGCSEYSPPDSGYRDSSAAISPIVPVITPVLQLLLLPH